MNQQKFENISGAITFFTIIGFLMIFKLPFLGSIVFFGGVISIIYLSKKYPKEHANFLQKHDKKNKLKEKQEQEKYKEYRYSYERLSDCKTSNSQEESCLYFTQEITKKENDKQSNLKNYREQHQNEYLSKLKVDFFEEYNKEPNFEKQKQCIFADGEDGFDYINDYHADENEHQSEREYFMINGKWAFFDYNDDFKRYKLTICDNKIFYSNCYIDNISKKTKKLLKYVNENPGKTEFFEADLKNQDKILKTGNEIECIHCDYIYFSDNKKCPNCGCLTRDTLEG